MSQARSNVFKLRDIVNVKDPQFGAKGDGSDETTTLINAVTAAFAVGDQAVIVIPEGVHWHPQTFFADANIAARTKLAYLDLSGLNSYNAAGNVSREYGLLCADTDTSDSKWAIVSGHHPALLLNNLGTAGTTSGDKGVQSILFARGYFTDGADDTQGYKPAAVVQFRESTAATSRWAIYIRSLSPWEALADGAVYKRWAASTAFATGDYCFSTNNAIYKATVGGTTGGSAPSHTSGTAADGTVTWLYVDEEDRTVFTLDQWGRFALNGGDTTTDLFAAKQSALDTASTAAARVSGTGQSKTVWLVLEPTDAGSSPVSTPFLAATTGGSLQVRDSTNSVALADFSDSGGMLVAELRSKHTTAADQDATPSVDGISTLYLSNSLATNVTALDDGDDGQIVTLVALDGNTTLVHAATLMLTGSVNQALTAYSSVTFQKVPNAISNRWIEIARSIK